MKTKKMRDMADTVGQILSRLHTMAGIDHADVGYTISEERSVKVRAGAIDKIETSEALEIGISAWMGDQYGSTAFTSLIPADIDAALDAMYASIKLSDPDPEQRPLEIERTAKIRNHNRLDLYDPAVPDIQTMIARARAAEDATLSVARVSHSDGCTAGWSRTTHVSIDTNNTAFNSRTTHHALSATAIAESNNRMEREHDSHLVLHGSDLRDPSAIGLLAGNRAVNALDPRAGRAGQYPVIFAPEMASNMLRYFSTAINSGAIRYKQSFFGLDQLGNIVTNPSITILDNPHMKRGLASRMYNGVGMATSPRTIVENGVLQNVFMSLKDSRHFNMAPTGASSNLSIQPNLSLSSLFGDLVDGLYVTGLRGQGINMINGDYSQSAQGFWIQNGQITHPVSNMTIAGNLRDMFKSMVAGDDLDKYKRAISSPTLRIDGMTIA